MKGVSSLYFLRLFSNFTLITNKNNSLFAEQNTENETNLITNLIIIVFIGFIR